MAQLELESSSDCNDARSGVLARVALGRLFRIEQIGKALCANTSMAQTMRKWRDRNRTMWAETDLADINLNNASGAGSGKKVEEDIADLRAQAARRADSRAVRRAALIESWAEDNCAAIRDLASTPASGHTVLTWPAAAPSQDGGYTYDMASANHHFQDVLETLAHPRVHGKIYTYIYIYIHGPPEPAAGKDP